MSRRPPPSPRYLEHATEVRVRFHEVDALRVVWHGHYVGYFEEGREAFGRAFGLGYADMEAAGFVVPLVHVEVDYAAPARLGDVLTVVTRLHPAPAARLTFTYEVRAADARLLATGRTDQVFTDLEGKLALTRPPVYEAFLARWDGALSTPTP